MAKARSMARISYIGAKQYAVTHLGCTPPAPFDVIVIELDGRSVHVHADRDAASRTRNICGHEFLSVFDHMRDSKDRQARTYLAECPLGLHRSDLGPAPICRSRNVKFRGKADQETRPIGLDPLVRVEEFLFAPRLYPEAHGVERCHGVSFLRTMRV
jgi:hypothetical protein